MSITSEQFAAMFPQNERPAEWAAALSELTPKYGIDSMGRLVDFLAQCGHESEGFAKLHENLNYSAQALLATWPTHFTPQEATQYARQPERIANRAYAGRMGNGPEESGDGWKHRGRGAMQVTGRNNYVLFSKAAGKTYDEVFDYLETIRGAAESACWYWAWNHLNRWSDANDFVTLTRRINGGLNGLEDRLALRKRIAVVLGQ